MANYAINGFGRIGRNVLRAMTQKQVERVRAINDLTDTKTLAHLLKWDSVHGKFQGEIDHDEENIVVRGHAIRIFKERDPGNLPYMVASTADEVSLMPQGELNLRFRLAHAGEDALPRVAARRDDALQFHGPPIADRNAGMPNPMHKLGKRLANRSQFDIRQHRLSRS